jgi:hypothetical protein
MLEGAAESGALEQGVAAGAVLLGEWLKNRADGDRLFPNGILGRRRRQGAEEQPPDVQTPSATPPSERPPPEGAASGRDQTQAREASVETPEEVTANKPVVDEPQPERRRFRLFDRRRDRRQDEPEED